MITLSVVIVSFIVTGFLFGLFKRNNYANENNSFRKSIILKILAVTGISILVAIINPIAVERIDSGNVGIKVSQTGGNNGSSSIEYARGWVFYNSWFSRIYEFPIFQQHVDYPENTVITKGGFQAVIKPSLNYSIKPGAVDDMFQSLRRPLEQIQDQWLSNAVVSSVNDIANLYTVDSVFNHRAEFESEILRECNKRVSKWFVMSQLRTNIQPPEALRKSIEAKTQAIQEVQVAENQRQVAVAEAQRKIASARGDSAEAVIQAAGRAESIRKEQLVLTELYIKFLNSQKWDGKYPQVMTGGATMLQLPVMGEK